MTPEPAPTIVNCQLITGDTAGLFIRSWGVELTPEPAPTINNYQLIINNELPGIGRVYLSGRGELS
ncbi:MULTISPECIES: hypothetical protein [Limnospira]|uniref:hypothetical protein n=1 Tax=Limnospira TaxID=2596745 RepID=UPI0003027879|nr:MULTISPECIES: hypothetical protein [Limnospira]MDT9263128.1 hypothetical protein [Limnospira sp. PMC 1223.20]MDT9288898.1 hypothetical protein [Limnospira sp. PMC 1295.21]